MNIVLFVQQHFEWSSYRISELESDSESRKHVVVKNLQIRQQHVDEDPLNEAQLLGVELGAFWLGWLNFGCQEFEAGRHPHPREGYTQGCADHAVPPWLQSRSRTRLTLRPAVKRCRLDEFVEVDKKHWGEWWLKILRSPLIFSFFLVEFFKVCGPYKTA